jgi:predicted unusual protein kinase regulating ubiquinone biosynthesis (AarF/ABC1/UbiB family)
VNASPPRPPQAAPATLPPLPPGDGGEPRPAIDWRRYRKLRWFVARTFVQAFVEDVVLARPLLRWARRPPLARWQEVARRYRALAVEMGGVLIKLGQFLSIRVDLLPAEVTRELAGLQDEVPPEPFSHVEAQIAADFGRPATEVFAAIDPTPRGSASLAQVHAARLPATAGDDAGREVVIKVLRPGIERIVETDLAAIRLAVRLLKPWRRVRRRVDLDRLADEITDTTRAELDLAAEGHNAERFAHDFAGDPRVVIPRVFWQFSAARTLALENVAYLKIADHAALDAAGVSRPQVAKTLYGVYMQQIFVHDFVHADPHPGNLFVKPLPWPEGAPDEGAAAGADGAVAAGRPFQLVFVDFGMVASIPQRLRAALREYLFGLGTRDAERIVHAYQAAGVLLPGADLRRLVEVHEDLFQRFWGVKIGELRRVALSEARYFLREYRDLLFELPFQVQVDMLFVSRAVGLLAGLTTSLDPEFDPWAETLPFAEELAAEELAPGLGGWLKLLAGQAAVAARLPEKAERVLTRAERGTLSLQMTLPPEVRRNLDRLERLTHRLGWLLVAASLGLGAVILRSAEPTDPLGPWLFGGAAAAFLWGVLRGR